MFIVKTASASMPLRLGRRDFLFQKVIEKFEEVYYITYRLVLSLKHTKILDFNLKILS